MQNFPIISNGSNEHCPKKGEYKSELILIRILNVVMIIKASVLSNNAFDELKKLKNFQ